LKYICKECSAVSTADNMDEILKYRKLCTRCLSESNQKTLVRKTPITRKNNIRSKPRKDRIQGTFVCNNCQTDSNSRSKPWECKVCRGRSFYRSVKQYNT